MRPTLGLVVSLASFGLATLGACRGTGGGDVSTPLAVEDCRGQVASGSCSYYGCLESERPCGETGYALHYGARYCERFRGRCDQTLPSTPALDSWRAGTAKCLQAKLQDTVEQAEGAGGAALSCVGIENAGFKSHGYCYTEGAVAFGGKSFCDLSTWDWYSIRGCIDTTDNLSRKGLEQILEAGARCAPIFGGLFGLTEPAEAENSARQAAMTEFLRDTERLLATLPQ